LGRVVEADLEASLQLGVATSGYFVHTGSSPTITELQAFIESNGCGT